MGKGEVLGEHTNEAGEKVVSIDAGPFGNDLKVRHIGSFTLPDGRIVSVVIATRTPGQGIPGSDPAIFMDEEGRIFSFDEVVGFAREAGIQFEIFEFDAPGVIAGPGAAAANQAQERLALIGEGRWGYNDIEQQAIGGGLGPFQTAYSIQEQSAKGIIAGFHGSLVGSARFRRASVGLIGPLVKANRFARPRDPGLGSSPSPTSGVLTDMTPTLGDPVGAVLQHRYMRRD